MVHDKIQARVEVGFMIFYDNPIFAIIHEATRASSYT